MKFLTPLLALATAAQAHYNFPSMNGGTAWSNVRQWTGYYTFDPVTNVASDNIRCNVNASLAPSTLSVAAGSTLKWAANPDIYHPGPLLAYMAKVPAGSTAATWDGAGTVWFKIYEDHPMVGTAGLVWPSVSATSVSFKIPAAVPSGDYLFRIEHIGLHAASGLNGAQFYISCGQLSVTGGGAGTPSPLVAFPGAYKATDPGIKLDIYYPVPTNYQPPGPAVWSG
ncbi:glycoside hydrolase family 61 protein [Hyaloscypha variabilis]